MNGGVAMWENILTCLAGDTTTEDKLIDMIQVFCKNNVTYPRLFTLLACVLGKKKFKCAKWMIDSGLIEDMEQVWKQVFRFHYWESYKYMITALFEFGVKLPTKSILLGWLSNTERRDVMKKIHFLEKLKSGGNNARKAALNMLAIIRFRRNEHMANCINMDVMRMIARMIYESGATEWKVWKTSRRKSSRVQEKKKIKR